MGITSENKPKKHINIGLVAHVDAGKTTLSEALLYTAGAIRKLGRVDNKDAFLDTQELERARGITIFSKQAEFQTWDVEFTLLDTPGHVDFSAEMERTLQVLDYALLVISGADGVQGHTQTLWRLLKRYHVPVFLFVNKMDQMGTSRTRLMEQLKNQLSDACIDFTVPDMEEIAMCDEMLMTQYLQKGEIGNEFIVEFIAKRQVFPCFFGSALKLQGIEELMKALASYTKRKSYPTDFGAKVFKIVRDAQGTRLTHLKVTGGVLKAKMILSQEEKVNQIRVYTGEKYKVVSEVPAGKICAVVGPETTKAGQGVGIEKMSRMPLLEPVLHYKLKLPEEMDALLVLPKLRMLEEEIPELHVEWNSYLQEIQVQVMGAVQIEILESLLESRFGVKASFGTGEILYKETIEGTVEGVGHFEPLKHYAEVHLLLEQGERGSGIVIETDCSEEMLERNWQRLIVTHLYERGFAGVLTGSPLTDVKITLAAGRAHQKHTEGGDFRQATYRAVRQGLMQAKSVLLEPYYEIRLTVPSGNVGRAMTDLERMHGEFALEQQGEEAVLTGSVPVSEFGDYQKEVVEYTKGHGQLICRLQGYRPCHNAEEVIEQIGYEPERDTINTSDSVFCAHGAGFQVKWNHVFDYMHLESVLERRRKRDNLAKIPSEGEALRGRRKTGESDQSLGTDEVDAILRQAHLANSKADGKGGKKISGRGTSQVHQMYGEKPLYRGKEPVLKNKKSYLLVDGYNIIYAWEELRELAKENMDSARDRLLDILCNYQGMKQSIVIVVFDAYRVKGNASMMDYHNIHVVYTKEAQTADAYIERFAHENGKKYFVTVATSDGMEQIIIRGQGCLLLSAKELEAEVKQLSKELGENWVKKNKGKEQIGQNIGEIMPL